MKRLFTILFAAAALAVAATGCYDDSFLQSQINELKDRVGTLEEQMRTANSNIGNLTTLVEALGKKLTVTSIEEKDGTYTINFSEGAPITIKNGVSPQIGVKQDSDGIYYWTLNGDWLLDAQGNKLRVTGEDGAPGLPGESATAPKLDIVDGYWYISTDDGATWEKLGKATGENGQDGDAFFKAIDWDAAYLYLTMADGTKLTISRGTYGIKQLAVVPDYSDGSVMIDGDAATMRFDVRPAPAASGLRHLPKDNYSLNVAYTMTKAAAGDELNLSVTGVMIEDGRITITVDASALDASFRKGTLGANANLTITYDQFNQVMSGYFPLTYFDKFNGHDYVDLGLSVVWATCNVDAIHPAGSGGFYAWGELNEKPKYEWSNYLWADGVYDKLTKYCTNEAYGTFDNARFLADDDDVAHQKWGGAWRLPNKAEMEELCNQANCSSVWTIENGVVGRKFTSKKEGYTDKSIFLPAYGFYDGAVNKMTTAGFYWSSSLITATPYGAYCLEITSGAAFTYEEERYRGFLVRPVVSAPGPDPEPVLGTLDNPFTPAQAAEAVKDLSWTSNTVYEYLDDVYVKGNISRILDKGTFTEGGTYGNASFFISEDGTTDEFYCFRILYLGNKKFATGQTDIKVGDDVIIHGQLMNYRGTTPETVSGKAYIYSLNGKTE